jgi:hypothetical protein
MLQNHWRHLTPVFALLIFGLVGVGCDSSGLSGPDERGVDGQTTARKGPPAGVPGGPPSGVPRGGNDADVRVAHLSPDAPAVNVSLNGKQPVKELSYTGFAPDGSYLDVAPGSYDISVTASGGGNEVIGVEGFSLESNKDYTILAVGELSPEEGEPDIRALPLVDNEDEETTLPPRDKTLVRFVHASPDAGAVDIGVMQSSDPLLEGVEFGDASDYLEIAPGDYTITVNNEALKKPFTVDVKAVAGTKITAYVIGNAFEDPEDGENSGLQAVTSLEATNPAGTGSFVDRNDDDEDEDEEEYEDEEDDDE